jgi:hypothetical protein
VRTRCAQPCRQYLTMLQYERSHSCFTVCMTMCPFPAIPGLVASLGPMAVPKLRQVVLTGNHLGETAVKTLIDSLTQVKFVVSDYSATIGAAVEEEEKLDVR